MYPGDTFQALIACQGDSDCDADFYLEGHAPGPQSRKAMVDELAIYQTIGRESESSGADRPILLSNLQTRLGRTLG